MTNPLEKKDVTSTTIVSPTTLNQAFINRINAPASSYHLWRVVNAEHGRRRGLSPHSHVTPFFFAPSLRHTSVHVRTSRRPFWPTPIWLLLQWMRSHVTAENSPEQHIQEHTRGRGGIALAHSDTRAPTHTNMASCGVVLGCVFVSVTAQ